MSYTQGSKKRSREALWQHAVEALTINRRASRVLRPDYVDALWQYAWNDVLSKVLEVPVAEDRIRDHIVQWSAFSDSCYGSKNPGDLRVAYFSGPEPENDLYQLLSLGVRIENVWAFESDKTTYNRALAKAREHFPSLKIFPGSLAAFFRTTHLAFDIVYLDFTGSLIARNIKTLSVLHASFDEQALADLSVLIVNSCEPDPTSEVCEFLSAYYYFQPMVEQSVYGTSQHQKGSQSISPFDESATATGHSIADLARMIQTDIESAYSAFATSYPSYYATFISPTLRFLRNPVLRRQLFNMKTGAQQEAFDRMSDVSSFFFEEALDDDSIDGKRISGDRILDADAFPLWNFIETLKTTGGTLGKYWHGEYSKSQGGASVLDAAKFRESLHETFFGYDGLLAENIKEEIRRVYAAIPDPRGGLFCDVPMPYLWLELGLNQLGAPYHANIRTHRRWSYTARVRRMHLDAFTFDRCRSLYDSLPMVDMYGDVFENLLPQMIVRCCMDAIHKEVRWPLPNLYAGSNMACIGDFEGADFAELCSRLKIAD